MRLERNVPAIVASSEYLFIYYWKKILLILLSFNISCFTKQYIKLGIHLEHLERIANENIRCYRSVNVHAKANANRTFDSCSARFPHEAAHQRQFVRDVDVHVLFSLLFAGVHYQNHHILDYRNHNLNRESFFQVLI